jgi:hypothetical protein
VRRVEPVDCLALTSCSTPFLPPATPVDTSSRMVALVIMQPNISDHRLCDMDGGAIIEMSAQVVVIEIKRAKHDMIGNRTRKHERTHLVHKGLYKRSTAVDDDEA